MRLKRRTTFLFYFGECSGKIFAIGDLAIHHYFLSFFVGVDWRWRWPGKKKESLVYGMVDEMGRTYNNIATLLGLLPIL